MIKVVAGACAAAAAAPLLVILLVAAGPAPAPRRREADRPLGPVRRRHGRRRGPHPGGLPRAV